MEIVFLFTALLYPTSDKDALYSIITKKNTEQTKVMNRQRTSAVTGCVPT